IEQIQKSIIAKQKNASDLSKIVHQLNNTREQLLKHFNNVLEETEDKHGECPFCGYDWKTFENLLTEVQSKRKTFLQYYDDATESLDKIVNELYEKHINTLLKQIQEELEEQSKSDKEFFLQLKDAVVHK